MPFVARSFAQIYRDLAARVVARSPLTDLTEGSVLAHILASVAQEIQRVELRLRRIRQSYDLSGVTGTDLDERAAEFPLGGLARQGASPASGGSVTLTRSATVGALNLDAGIILGRSDDSTQQYRTLDAATWADGAATTTNTLRVVALTAGIRGNCPAGRINTLIEADDAVISVVQGAALSNGQDAETDARLRGRLEAHLASLARCQPIALQLAALNHQTEEGERVRFASIYEDPLRPGVSELLIDDGSAGAGGQRAGARTTGTVPDGGALVFWFEYPAVSAPARITVTRGASTFLLRAGTHYTPIPERGLLYLTAVGQAAIQSGDVWEVVDYQVYTGLVEEIQRIIEGVPGEPASPGRRAAGTRVIVRPAEVQTLTFDLWVLLRNGAQLSTVVPRVKAAAEAFASSLAPGETFYVAQLIDALMEDADLLSLRVYKAGTRATLDDVPASSHTKAIRAPASGIHVVPATED